MTDHALYPHQEEARRFLMGRRRAYLCDVPRLGKTDPVAAAAGRIAADCVVVVCPAIVRTHWHNTMERYNVRATVMSYEAAMKWDGTPDLLILDEAHYLANPAAKRTRAILGSKGFARRAERVWCLSGTPMSKHPGQLWPILVSLFPEIVRELGVKTLDQFLAKFTYGYNHPQYGYKPLGVKNEDVLHAALFGSGAFLRRTEDDVAVDFPPLRWDVVELDGSKIDPVLYAERVEDLNNPGLARALACDAKLPAVLERLEERLGDWEPIVVLAHFQRTLDAVQEKLDALNVGHVRVDGRTTPNDRTLAIEMFQQGRVRVFLGSIRACQTGITLDRANEVWIVEPDWTADVNVQAGKRAFSHRQTRRCVTSLFVLAGSIDEAIIRSHWREIAMSDAVLDARS